MPSRGRDVELVGDRPDDRDPEPALVESLGSARRSLGRSPRPRRSLRRSGARASELVADLDHSLAPSCVRMADRVRARLGKRELEVGDHLRPDRAACGGCPSERGARARCTRASPASSETRRTSRRSRRSRRTWRLKAEKAPKTGHIGSKLCACAVIYPRIGSVKRPQTLPAQRGLPPDWYRSAQSGG